MGPRELLKSSSPSFGRAGDCVTNCDSSRLLAYPSVLGARSLGESSDDWGTCEGTPTLKSVKQVVSSQVGEQ